MQGDILLKGTLVFPQKIYKLVQVLTNFFRKGPHNNNIGFRELFSLCFREAKIVIDNR